MLYSHRFSILLFSEVAPSITKPLQEIQTVEEQTVSLSCEVSHPNLKAIWLKDGKEIQPDEHCEVIAQGCIHTLIVHNANLEDEAEYTVQISDTVMSKATLWVEGRLH